MPSNTEYAQGPKLDTYNVVRDDDNIPDGTAIGLAPVTPEQADERELAVFIDELVNQVRVRTRYDRFDELVGDIVQKPGKDEIVAAIFDALDEINSYPPETRFNMLDLKRKTDTRWKKALTLAASKNFIQTLVFDWTANGFGPQIEDLQIENKLSDFKDLQSTLDSQFKEFIEKLKFTAIKIARHSTFATTKEGRLGNLSNYRGSMYSRYMKATNVGQSRR